MAAIRWSTPASEDFLGIIKWISRESPSTASRVGQAILGAIEILKTHSHAGRPGRSPETRELAISRLPYLVIYDTDFAVPSDVTTVVILRVLHGAMLWPRDGSGDPSPEGGR